MWEPSVQWGAARFTGRTCSAGTWDSSRTTGSPNRLTCSSAPSSSISSTRSISITRTPTSPAAALAVSPARIRTRAIRASSSLGSSCSSDRPFNAEREEQGVKGWNCNEVFDPLLFYVEMPHGCKDCSAYESAWLFRFSLSEERIIHERQRKCVARQAQVAWRNVCPSHWSFARLGSAWLESDGG